MTLFSLIVALLLEQLRPLPAARFVQAPLKGISQSGAMIVIEVKSESSSP